MSVGVSDAFPSKGDGDLQEALRQRVGGRKAYLFMRILAWPCQAGAYPIAEGLSPRIVEGDVAWERIMNHTMAHLAATPAEETRGICAPMEPRRKHIPQPERPRRRGPTEGPESGGGH